MEETERNVLFTNTYITSEKTDRQMFRRIRRIPRLIVFLFSSAFFGYLIYLFIRMLRQSAQTGEPITQDSSFLLFVMGLALYVLLIVREILAPGTFSKRQEKRLKELYDTDHITIESDFTDDAIDFHNQASHTNLHLPYSALNLLTETKDLFLIRTKERQVIALAKNGFIGTDAAGFRSFMQGKCPDAKHKWKEESRA